MPSPLSTPLVESAAHNQDSPPNSHTTRILQQPTRSSGSILKGECFDNTAISWSSEYSNRGCLEPTKILYLTTAYFLRYSELAYFQQFFFFLLPEGAVLELQYIIS